MRLGIKLLNTSASLNSFKQVSTIKLVKGETLDLFFQLVDLEQNGLRYIPPTGSIVEVTIPRSPVIEPSQFMNARETIDYSIARQAVLAFPEDRSIWKLPLIETETVNMISNSIRVVVTEGTIKKIAFHNGAIQVIDGQDQ